MDGGAISEERMRFVEQELERQLADPYPGWRSGISADELRALIDENRALRSRVTSLEEACPHWARGFTSDSVAAQTYMAAATALWKELGVGNQGEAMEALRELMASRAEPDEGVPGPSLR
jgi:hypothetical protein